MLRMEHTTCIVSLTVTQARLRQAAEGADKHTGHGVCCVCPSPPRDAAVLNRVIARQDASHNMTDGEIDPEKLLAFLQQVGGLFAQEKQRQHVMSLGPSTTLAQGKSAPEPHNVPTVTASVHMPDALHVLELFHTFTQKGLKQLKSLERGQIKAPHTNREAMCKAICQWQLAEYVKGLSANDIAFNCGHSAVRRVFYPGLSSHPDHEAAKRQMRGFSGVITFELEADLDGAKRFIDALELPYQAPSLGGVESLVELPITMSYWDYSAEERASMGITDSMVRFSCGVEDIEDIQADLQQALERI